MILHLDGNVNRYYVQTLCMAFFPGATFGENEQPAEDVPEVTVSVETDGSGAVSAFVSIRMNDVVSEATETVLPQEKLVIATHEAIAVGRALFAAGKKIAGNTPPWGILTGVRPAKVAGQLLSSGNSVAAARRILRDEYFLYQQKADLAVAVAEAEESVLRMMPRDECSLYISIPFCPTRCAYCSFISYATPRLLSMVEDYLEALLSDLEEAFAAIAASNLKLSTVYIGGGTPTTLTVEQLERLLSKLASHTDLFALREFTLEAGRPDTITAEKLAVAKKYGVSRISVNPQTLSDEILRQIGRRHTVQDFFDAYELARESGIRDINVDLIAGLPGDDFQNFSETIDRIIKLEPTNLTVHTFCVKKAADLRRENDEVYSLPGREAAKSVSYAQIQSKFAGYKPYYMYRQKNTIGNLENVGFALEGHEGLYNIFMMEETQTIFGVGAGAVTKLVKLDPESGKAVNIKRIFHPKYPYEYLRKAKQMEENQASEDVQKLKLSAQATAFFADNT